MATKATTHPADETLVSYGLGKLDDTQAESVGKHLERCDPCRRRVTELSSDSFLGRLQNAKPGKQSQLIDSGAARPKTLAKEVPASFSEKLSEQPTAAALPAELREHPQYEVIRELGRGGMGVVYLARNKLMDRFEVLKVLNKHMLAKESTADRFLREIQSAAKLHHPNVVAAYTAFLAGDLLVFAMEYVEGEDLGKLIRSRGPLPVLNACYFAYQAAQGLQHAHERGMIHRDIKPGNLVLMREGKKATIKILDFGLAKVRSEQRLDRTLTQAGQMLGTPDYISPEQTLDAQNADIRTDIYSLGCTLYHLLTGSPPFSGNSLYEVLQAHHSVEAKPLNLVCPEVPAELAAVVAKMMAKEPERRYQTPADVARALKSFLKPGGAAAPKVGSSRIETKETQSNRAASTRRTSDDATPLSLPALESVHAERWKSLLDLPAFERSSANRKAMKSQPRPQRPWVWLWSAAAATVLATIASILWACGVFSVRVETANGVIVLKNLPPGAVVLVDNNRVQLAIPREGGSAELSIAPGKHRIDIKKGDTIIRGERLTIASGSQREIDVEWQPGSDSGSDAPLKHVNSDDPLGTTHHEQRVSTSATIPSHPRVGEVRRYLGHKAVVSRVAFLPDGRSILSGGNSHNRIIKDGRGFHPAGDDNTVRLWDVASGKNTLDLKEHDWDIRALAVSADGRHGASSSGWVADYAQKLIIVWDLKTGRVLHRFTSGTPSRPPHCIAMAFTRDGRRLAAAYTNGSIHVYDLDSEREFPVIKLKDGVLKDDEFNSAAFVADTHQLVTGSHTGLVELWDVDTANSLQVMLGHAKPVTAVKASADGTRILSGSADRSIRLWDAKTGKEIQTLLGHGAGISSVDLSMDGRLALSGSGDTTVRLWDLAAGKEICQFANHEMGVTCVAFAPDAATAVSGSADSSLRLWQLPRSGEPFEAPADARVAFSGFAEPEPGETGKWEPLFDGSSLAGWTPELAESKPWKVADGVVESDGIEEEEPNCLLTNQDWSDFQLRLDYRLSSQGIAAIAIRAIPKEKMADRLAHPCLKLMDTPAAQETGSSRWLLDNRILTPDRPAVAGLSNAWNHLELTVRGRRFSARVNGKQILALATDSDLRLPNGNPSGLCRVQGRIGLVKSKVPPFVKNTVQFRNVEIRRLGSVAGTDDRREQSSNQVPKSSTLSTPSPDRKAAQAVLALGGSVTIRVGNDERQISSTRELPDGPFSLWGIDLQDKGNATDADFEPLEGIANLHSLKLNKLPNVSDAIVPRLRNSTALESFWFENANVGDAGLELLERFTSLKSLGLRNTHVSDTTLAHLEHLTQIDCLGVGGTKITDAGLAHLRNLPQLAILWVENTQVSNRGLAHLKGLSNLRELILFGTGVNDSGLSNLKSASKLEYLDLSGLRVTDKGIATLSGLSNIKTLWAKETAITDAGLLHLSHLTKLERLGIQGTHTTDSGLLHLKRLANLNMLLTDGTQITPDGLQALERAKIAESTSKRSKQSMGRGTSSKKARKTNRTSQGFVPLFNGRNLNGWKFAAEDQGAWSVQNGVLTGFGIRPDAPSRLATSRSDYANFYLRMEVRSPDELNKHLMFRSADINGNEDHYRFHLGGLRADGSVSSLGDFFQKSGGSLFDDKRSTKDGLSVLVEPGMEPLSPNEWHTVELKVVGPTFYLRVDDHDVSAFRDELARLTQGQIVISIRKGARIELKNVEINELGKKPA